MDDDLGEWAEFFKRLHVHSDVGTALRQRVERRAAELWEDVMGDAPQEEVRIWIEDGQLRSTKAGYIYQQAFLETLYSSLLRGIFPECPYCEHRNPPGESRCNNCGERL